LKKHSVPRASGGAALETSLVAHLFAQFDYRARLFVRVGSAEEIARAYERLPPGEVIPIADRTSGAAVAFVAEAWRARGIALLELAAERLDIHRPSGQPQSELAGAPAHLALNLFGKFVLGTLQIVFHL